MKIAIITDIHGNLEGLSAILKDINKKNIDRVICLGDVIGLGPNSQECLSLLIDNNIDMVLGNHELYCIKGPEIDSSIEGEEKEHYKWIKKSLSQKSIEFLKKCPISYEINIKYEKETFNKKIILSHYLINNQEDAYPFEKNHLKKDINLWIKYNNPNIIYIIGHLHKSFNINEVDGITGDYIEELGELTNIEVVDSSGCSPNDEVSYTILTIAKDISLKKVKVKYDRTKLINKINLSSMPDKKNILKYFYGVE